MRDPREEQGERKEDPAPGGPQYYGVHIAPSSGAVCWGADGRGGLHAPLPSDRCHSEPKGKGFGADPTRP